MYVIIWEYQVKAEHVAEFEEIYSATGAWAELFQRSKDYMGTELLSREGIPYLYITIDRWTSSQAFQAFLSEWKDEYVSLDSQCEGLTEGETLLGKWKTY